MTPEAKDKVARQFGLPFEKLDYLLHIDDVRRIAYFETPKVACTTIKKYMQDAYVGRVQTYANPSLVHDRRHSPLKQLSELSEAQVADVLYGDYVRFGFVRNPFTRTLSAYLDKVVNNEFERKRHLPLLGFEQGYTPTYKEFLHALKNIPDEERDIHYQSQALLLGSGNIEFDFIGFFECFEEDFSFVRRDIYNDPMDTDYRAFGQHHAMRANSRVLEFYGSEEIALIKTLYRQDFSCFRYPGILEASSLIGERVLRPAYRRDALKLVFSYSDADRDLSNPEPFDRAWKKLLAKEYLEAAGLFAEISIQYKGTPLGHRAYDCASHCYMKSKKSPDAFITFHTNREALTYSKSVSNIARASLALYYNNIEEYWHLARQLPTYDAEFFGPWNRGLRTRPEFNDVMQIRAWAQDDLSYGASLGSTSNADTIILIAAESNFFMLHGEQAVASYRKVSGTERIYLLLIDPSEEALEIADRLARPYNCTVLIEQAPAKSEAFLSAAPYLHAADIMRQNRASVCVIDMAFCFRESISSFFSRCKIDPNKVGLRISPRLTYPWQKLSMNCAYFPWNDVGLIFARHMQKFLQAHFSVPGDHDLKWIEQNAALSAYLSTDSNSVQHLNINGFVAPSRISSSIQAL